MNLCDSPWPWRLSKLPPSTSAVIGVDAELRERRGRDLQVRGEVQGVVDDLELRVDEVDRQAADAGRNAQRDALPEHVVGGLKISVRIRSPLLKRF